MSRYRTSDHPMMAAVAWDPARPAVRITDFLMMVHATSNCYLIAGNDGDLLINAATLTQAPRAREKFELLLGRSLNIGKIIFTQSHPDHTGGWAVFAQGGTTMIAQREFERINAERKLLGPFFAARNRRVLSLLIPPAKKGGDYWFNGSDPVPAQTFSDSLNFEFSGRQFHLFTLSSGETEDSLGVWLPGEKILFIGNWAGAIMGAFPHFHTARGDRDRSVTRWLTHCQQMIDLAPEMLVTGHESPIIGNEAVRAHLCRLRDAVRYVHDETVKGMVAGRSLADLRASIALPKELETKPGRGPIDWYVRSVWEEYGGWFHHDLTSELYAEPASAIWPELAEMAGGAERLAQRAQALVAAGDPVRALHFSEIASAAAPRSRAVLEAHLAVLEALADQTEGRPFDLLGWLEGRIAETRAALDASGSD